MSRDHSDFLSFYPSNDASVALFVESCASAASRPGGLNLAISGLSGRQRPQVNGAAFSLTWVFVWEEINTLPCEGGEVLRSLCAHMEMQHQLFSEKQSDSPRSRSPESTPGAKHRNVRKSDRERPVRCQREQGAGTLCLRWSVSRLRAEQSPSACLTHNLGPESSQIHSFRPSLSK